MIRLRRLAPAAALTLGLLSVASAQEINTDATGTAGAAAKAAQSGASAATNTQTNGQLGQGANNVNANQQTDANVDLNTPDTPQTDAEAISDGVRNDAGNATEQVRESARQQTDALDRDRSQIDPEGDLESSLNTDTTDNSSRLRNQTDAAANAQTDGLQNSSAGMTFRSNTDSIIVDNVADGSAASRLGLRPGDEIVRFNGQWVRNTQDLQRMMNNVEGSRPVDISFRRDGRQMGRQIQLGAGVQSSSAMRPNYDQSEAGVSGTAGVDGNNLVDGQVSGQAMHHGGHLNYSGNGHNQFGNSFSGYQPNLNYGQSYGYAPSYDLRRDNCCRRVHRRHRRCCR